MRKLRGPELLILPIVVFVISAIIVGALEPMTGKFPYDECSAFECYRYASDLIDHE
jgi:hypothetical protein